MINQVDAGFASWNRSGPGPEPAVAREGRWRNEAIHLSSPAKAGDPVSRGFRFNAPWAICTVQQAADSRLYVETNDGAPAAEFIRIFRHELPLPFLSLRATLHLHHGEESFYVVEGGMIELKDGKQVPFPTGTTGINRRDVSHGEFKVVGDKPIKYLSVHIVDKGAPLYDTPK